MSQRSAPTDTRTSGTSATRPRHPVPSPRPSSTSRLSDLARGALALGASLLLLACGGPPAQSDVAESGGADAAVFSRDAGPASGTSQVPPETGPGGRVILVTGSTGGLGRAVALRLGAEGDHVIVHGRNRQRGAEVVEAVEASGGSARFYPADFGSLDEVRRLATAIRRDYERLDVLVNNAGIAIENDDERLESEDGHELHFQVNYLSGYLLTHLLLPLLEASAPARVVNVSSLAAAPLDFDNLMLEEGYSMGRAYGQSKLAQVMFTFELAEELEGTGVTVNALHPATLMNTDMVEEMGVRPRSTVDEGADAVMQLIDGGGLGTGRYYDGLEPARAHDQAYDEAVRARLETLSDALTGLPVD